MAPRNWAELWPNLTNVWFLSCAVRSCWSCCRCYIFVLVQVVGSQARILYSNEKGRIALATSFNKAVADGRLKVLNYVHVGVAGMYTEGGGGAQLEFLPQ